MRASIFFCLLLMSFQEQSAFAEFWAEVERDLPVTTLGNKVAISCHNCYGTTLEATEVAIERALNQDMDLVELDLSLQSDQLVHVEHVPSDDSSRPLFAAVAQLSALRNSDALLFIEIKENFATATADTLMLQVLRTLRDQQLARQGRPVALRAFMKPQATSPHRNLIRAQSLLQREEFAGIRDFVRFHALVATIAEIQVTKDLGFTAVELSYKEKNLFPLVSKARSLGLGLGIYTIPKTFGEVFLSQFREDFDFITTDYDQAVRPLLTEDNSLLYLNTSLQTAYPLRTFRRTAQPFLKEAAAETPALDQGSLRFTGTQQLTLYDGDNRPGEGFLVSTVASFRDLTLAGSSTQSIVAKSDAGGFALELFRASAALAPVLRFGVRVGDAYHYATSPVSSLNLLDSFVIVGAYDSEGKVRLWVNGVEGTPSANVSGPVVMNNSPIVVGADPQGNVDRRFFLKGSVQSVIVQSWPNSHN